MPGAYRLNVCCRVRFLLLAAGCSLGSVPVLADEWHQYVTLPASLEYDSNPSLSTTNKQSVSRLIVVPFYSLVGTYGIDEFKAGLGLKVERSTDQRASIDREDPNLLFGWWRQTETGGFGLTTKYDQVSSRVAELEETGSTAADSTRKTWSLGGQWRAAITELSTLTAYTDYKTVTYDAGTQTNFNNLVAGISWNYAWSERIAPFLSFSGNHYDPDKSTGTAATSTYYTVSGGVSVKTSERLEWTAQGGPGRIAAGTSGSGYQGSLAMQYRGARYDAALNISRSANVSGDGGFIVSNRVSGTFGYPIDERSGLGFSASWQDNEGDNPNTLQQLGAWASHELSPFLTARLYYQHKLRRQDRQSDASADVLGVTLVYSSPSF
jgi:hypothetical protein